MDALPMQFETTGDYGGARESHGFLTGTEYTFSPLFCPVAEFETLYELVPYTCNYILYIYVVQ